METIFDQFMALAKPQGERQHSGEIMQAVPLPSPRCDVNVRVAAPGTDDLSFIDGLQKMHSHMVGFMPKKQIEAYINGEHIVIAEDEHKQPIGYCMAKDQYLKRDDVGIVYQLNVAPLKQRHLVGAALVKAVFERAAYGCKLFCCWCAQDIQANWFWESIGFVPIAFRTGSRTKQRVHIFWQKRIREGDEGPGATEYWYPHQTSAGAVAEDRIVLPIPPGTHWRDAKPLVLPGVMPGVMPGDSVNEDEVALPKVLPGGAPVTARPEQVKLTPEQAKAARERKLQVVRSASNHLKGCPPGKAAVFGAGGVKYVDRADAEQEEDFAPEAKPKKPKRASKPRMKHDPKHVVAARELRDRFLDEVNSGRMLLEADEAKYAVCRQLETWAEWTGAGAVTGTVTGTDDALAARRSQVNDDRLLDAA